MNTVSLENYDAFANRLPVGACPNAQPTLAPDAPLTVFVSTDAPTVGGTTAPQGRAETRRDLLAMRLTLNTQRRSNAFDAEENYYTHLGVRRAA